MAEDGSQSFTAIDQHTDELPRSTPLLGPDAKRAAQPESLQQSEYGSRCQDDAAPRKPATAAVCLVSDGFVRYEDDGTLERVPATTSRVVVVDTGDGHVVGEWAAEATAQLAVVGDLAVVWAPDAQGHVVVVAHDVRTGDERWRYTVTAGRARAATPGAPPDWGLNAAGSTVVVHAGDAVTVLSSTGAPVRDDLSFTGPGGGFGTDQATGAFWVSSHDDDGDPRTTLLAPDADPADDVVVQGEMLYVSVDDRSLPGWC